MVVGMGFVKLDCGMLDSTIWVDREARELFITALLMAVPYELKEPSKQLKVRSLEETGFVVPAGWYGKVEASGSGIVRRAGMELETGLSALERLGEPEPDSRTPDFDGRRLVRIDGGYLALNFQKYRDKDHTAAKRSRRYRERNRSRRRTKPVFGPDAREQRFESAVNNGAEATEQDRLITESLPEGLR